MANEPFWTATGVYTPAEFRRYSASLYVMPSAAPGGVLQGMGVSLVGANATVQPGSCVLKDTTGGVYVAVSTTVSSYAVPSWTVDRTDTLYAFVTETTGSELSLGLALNGAAIPTSPTFSIPLAQIQVRSTGNTIVTTSGYPVQVELASVYARYQLTTTDIAWTAPGLTALGLPAGSVDATLGSTTQYLRIRRSGNVVQLSGRLKGPFTGNAVVFTLPAQYRPAFVEQFRVRVLPDSTTVVVMTVQGVTPLAGQAAGSVAFSAAPAGAGSMYQIQAMWIVG